MKIRKKYCTENRYEISIADDVKLIVYFKVKKGKIEEFSLTFRKKFKEAWRTITRCDNSKDHKSVPHCHHYNNKGKPHFVAIAEKDCDLGSLVREIINHWKKNYKKILDNYKYSK